MNEITSINPDDARLTRQLVYESQAATAAYESTRIRNICLGSAAVVGAAGAGLAAMIWAWNQGVDPEAKQALKDMPPIQVAVEATLDPEATVGVKKDATVGIDKDSKVAVDGEVKVAEGGEVTAKGEVKIDPNATVKVTGEVGGNNAALEQQIKELQKQPKGHNAIKREVTVFNYLMHADGSVHTGWNYPDGASRNPKSQFCYFMRPNLDGSDYRVELAIDGRALTQNRKLLADFDGALAKCQWWKGAA